MVLSLWQAIGKSSLGSFDERRLSAEVPGGCQPKTKPTNLDVSLTEKAAASAPTIAIYYY